MGDSLDIGPIDGSRTQLDLPSKDELIIPDRSEDVEPMNDTQPNRFDAKIYVDKSKSATPMSSSNMPGKTQTKFENQVITKQTPTIEEFKEGSHEA